MSSSRKNVAIVDYGLGNLFSIEQACRHASLQATITSNVDDIKAADAVILPGVGAFGDAMAELDRRGLVGTLREFGGSGKPLMGICLGMQLLMGESAEFGDHAGLGFIAGRVERFDNRSNTRVKIPQIGWNRIVRSDRLDGAGSAWSLSPLSGLENGTFMYFVHSYHVQPETPDVILAHTTYGGTVYCSALQQGNFFGCQFHPERSGPAGLRLYTNFARKI